MNDVELTQDETKFIQHLINKFAAEIQDESPCWHIPYFTQHVEIPLYVRWFETTPLTTTGEIVMWNDGDYDSLRIPDDPRKQSIGNKTVLRFLFPSRVADRCAHFGLRAIFQDDTRRATDAERP